MIISAPSGAGKDTVIHRLVKELDDAVVYVTATSRKPRRNEHHGVDYYFYEPEKFRAEIEMAAAPEYDYVVVNDDGKIDETVKEIAEIVRKETKKPRHYDL